MSKSRFTTEQPLDPAMKKAKGVFAARYFDWALAQATNEVADRFPNLRAIEAPAVYHFLEFCDSRPAEISSRLLRALLRAAHSIAMSLASDSLEGTEVQLLREYSGKATLRHGPIAVTGLSSQRYMSMMQTKFAEEIPVSVQREIISTIATQFSYHGTISRPSVGSLEVVERVGPWYLTTHFACGSLGAAKLAYEHRISPFPYGEGTVDFYLGRTERCSHGISILDWLGIWAETKWMALPDGSPEEIGLKLAGMAKLFLAEAPRLLNGIEAPLSL